MFNEISNHSCVQPRQIKLVITTDQPQYHCCYLSRNWKCHRKLLSVRMTILNKVDMSLHSNTLSWFPANQSALSPACFMLGGEATNNKNNVYPDLCSNRRSTVHEESRLCIIPLILLIIFGNVILSIIFEYKLKLFISFSELETFSINPKPEWIINIELAK